MKFCRWIPLAAVLIAALSARADLSSPLTNVPPPAPGAPRRPCIILVQCHDLAVGDLSCYGQTNYMTPNLDRLTRQGVRFSNYSGRGGLEENLAAMLAGKTPAVTPGITNLAALLKQAGYRTGLIGEWPFDREPWLRGFDEFAGFFTDAEARDYYAERIWRYPHNIYDENNRLVRTFLDQELLYHNTGGNRGQYIPDLLFTAANNFIRIAAPDASNRWRPFFLMVNLPAPRSAKVGAEHYPVPSDAPFTRERWPQAAKDRAALLTRLDGNMGRLFEQLTQFKLTNNTVIIFASSAAPEKFTATNLFFLLPGDNFRTTNNPVPRLPLIVRLPSETSAGLVIGTAVSSADIAPTLLDIAYAKTPTNFSGRSLLPLIQPERKRKAVGQRPGVEDGRGSE